MIVRGLRIVNITVFDSECRARQEHEDAGCEGEEIIHDRSPYCECESDGANEEDEFKSW